MGIPVPGQDLNAVWPIPPVQPGAAPTYNVAFVGGQTVYSAGAAPAPVVVTGPQYDVPQQPGLPNVLKPQVPTALTAGNPNLRPLAAHKSFSADAAVPLASSVVSPILRPGAEKKDSVAVTAVPLATSVTPPLAKSIAG